MEKALRNVLIFVFVEKQLPLYANQTKTFKSYLEDTETELYYGHKE